MLGRLDGTLWLLDTRDGIKCSFEIIVNEKKKRRREDVPGEEGEYLPMVPFPGSSKRDR